MHTYWLLVEDLTKGETNTQGPSVQWQQRRRRAKRLASSASVGGRGGGAVAWHSTAGAGRIIRASSKSVGGRGDGRAGVDGR
jgi:hypothetical protein